MTTQFSDLGLSVAILDRLTEIGYQTPSEIQAKSIPEVLDGKDIIAMAQTGTGKTAAFALPLLSNLKNDKKYPQILVLTPTRELAMQVSEAFVSFAKNLTGVHILSIYGGVDYSPQIKALKRGTQVIVGTPGRVMDHIKKGTLKLDKLNYLVLDEADEMLQMGFIDDVKWILSHTPKTRQICLFSATMPKEIRNLSKSYLNQAKEIIIAKKTITATNITQEYWLVNQAHKFDALTRILEIESFDAMIIFLRTKSGTVELADKLIAAGYQATALNGDLAQNQRERIIGQFKKNKIDILIATDVAARGLDVPRISHVINYDVPQNSEIYVHRVGRTGRAGRSGKAILFISHKERRLLNTIEKMTKQSITLMEMPNTDVINQNRIVKFKDKINQQIEQTDLTLFKKIINELQQEKDLSANKIAAALASLYQGNTPFLLEEKPHKPQHIRGENRPKSNEGMTRYRLEVGKKDGVKAKNIIGAIANESGLKSQNIQNLSIEENLSFIDLPNHLSNDIFHQLKHTWVCQKQLNISKLGERSKKSRHKTKNFKKNKKKS